VTSGDDSTPGNPDEGVSTRAAQQLRDAIQRLLAGALSEPMGDCSRTTSGRAQVSRATMNRATRVLADWDSKIAACDGFTPRGPQNDQLAKLRTALDARTRDAPSYAASRRRSCSPSPPSTDNTCCARTNPVERWLHGRHRHLLNLTLDHQSEIPGHTDSETRSSENGQQPQP
jgi:hypothetical protein